ncbi:MlaD family protein [Phreatobacter aquaticus]|nr:MlaD family protein [Phreatobacter aquaticus]
METKANTTLIGAFTLGVLGLFFVFLWWFLRVGDSTNRTIYSVVFSGPVSGLSTGASVQFNGIRVGEVRSIRVDPADPRKVIAMIAVNPDTPIRTNTRVGLEVGLLSGNAWIALRGGDTSGTELAAPAPGQAPQLTADPSSVQDLVQAAKQIMSNVDQMVRRLDDTIAAGQGSVERSLGNVEKFTQALADNSDSIGTFLKDTGEAAKQISALAQRLDRVATQVEQLMEGAERGRVASIIRNVDDLTKSLASQGDSFAELIRDARGATQSITRTLGGADRVMAALDTDRIQRAMSNIDRFAQALGDNSGSVDQIARNASELVAKLNGMADRLDQTLKSFQGDGGAGGMMAEFTATAKAVRTLAERLDTRTSQLTTSISGFTDRTIRDIQALSTDGRRTLTELERTLRSLERNPQRFIFGGSGVPEFRR